MSGTTLVQLALALPLVAGLAWLALVLFPVARAVLGGLLALASHAAAWGVLILVYRGDQFSWRGFDPELLGATILVFTELALLLVMLRAETLGGGANVAAVLGVAVSVSAIAALTSTTSLAVVALVLPLPTIAAASVALSGRGPEDARGLIGLAAADVLALLGLSLAYARTGSIEVGMATGIGPALLVIAAAMKAGAVPGVATWRLSATAGPGAWLDSVVRGQAVALAALAALTMGGSTPRAALAIAAAAGMLVGGVAALVARTRERIVASATGVAAGFLFLALGLAGAIGTRAFLLLFPPFLLASAVVALLGRGDPKERTDRPEEGPGGAGVWGWLAGCALGVGVASLLGLPPGGAFPGAWLTLTLAATRAQVTTTWVLVAGAAAIGVVLALSAAVALIRSARPRAAFAIPAAILSLGLLYLGTEPIRLAIGWWVRIETALGSPEVLPTAGAPGLPAIGASRLLLALAPALVLALAVVAVGRGVRDLAVEPPTEAVPVKANENASRLGQRARALLAPVRAAGRPVIEVIERARAIGIGFGVAAVLELAVLLLVGRIVMLAARAGFL